MGWVKFNQSTCVSERTPKNGWKYLVRHKCGKNSCMSNPSKISTTSPGLWLSLVRDRKKRSEFAISLRSFPQALAASWRCYARSPPPLRQLWRQKDVTQPAAALTLHVPWLIFPSSSVPLDRRSLWKTFKRTLSFSAPSPLYLISFQEPLRA